MKHVRKRSLEDCRKSLNTHGYTFQYAVLRRLHQLANQKKPLGDFTPTWAFKSTEFPVEVRGSGTRIDFVLQRQRNKGGAGVSAYYMLAECKRANPAYSDWCFVRAPYTFFAEKHGHVVLDRARLVDNKNILVEPVEHYMGGEKYAAYHIAIEVKGTTEGDRHGSPKGKGIEEAVTQVMRGLNGMLEFLALYPSLFGTSGQSITLVPVIFTTAQLWASDVDLGAGDLYSGNIDISQLPLRQEPWLLYQYNLSPGLKHTLPTAGKDSWYNAMSNIIEREYVRTIAIVSATGIEDFLNWSKYIEVE